MQIFVINLPRDAARREHMTRQLVPLGLDYEIVAGVLGAGLTAEHRRQHYDDRKAKLRYSRSLLPSEIGCALSHLKVYREIEARRLGCALVLEDDVVLPRDLGACLAECEATIDPARPEVWLLSPARGDEAPPARARLRSGRSVVPFVSGVYTSSYIVTAASAKSMLAELYPVGDVADCWHRLARYGVVDLFVVSPPLIEQNQNDFGSSTTAEYWHQVGDGPFIRLAYKARRLRSVLWDAFYAPYRRWSRPRPSVQLDGPR